MRFNSVARCDSSAFRVVLGLDEPLANSLFHHRPEKTAKPPAKIEAAYHSADAAIQKLVDLIAA